MKPLFYKRIGPLLVLATIAGWLLWFRPATTSRPHLEEVGSQSIVESETSADSSTSSFSALKGTTETDAAVEHSSDRRKEVIRQVVQEQNVPIDFFGVVLDQEDEPVVGATVRINVRQWSVEELTGVSAKGHSISHKRQSDSNGLFRLAGVSGDAFTVEKIEKEGYQLSDRTVRSYPASVDSQNPVVFRMWKQGAKAPLVSGHKVFGIIPDGRTYTLDLVKGNKSESDQVEGDLRISITRPLGIAQKGKFAWSFQIEGVQGGLIRTEDEFMYLAPDTGYAPNFSAELSPADEMWTSLDKKEFYFTSRNGRIFGRMQVEVNAVYNDKSAIEIDYSLNPTSSRNLQP